MPTMIRRSETITLTEKRREILHAVGWQVTQNIWSPPTDVYETEKEFIVRVEIAGMREEDFEVIFENGYLFISGVRPDVSERRAYHQMEIRFGKFSTTHRGPRTCGFGSLRSAIQRWFHDRSIVESKTQGS